MTGDPIVIELTLQEVYICAMDGVWRRIIAIKKQRRGRWGQGDSRNRWQDDIIGSLGECALAKWRNVFWFGTWTADRPPDCDVAGYQVRATDVRNGCLLLHPEDRDQDVFVLALTHEVPRIYLQGWLYGSDGKLDEYWSTNTGRPAFFVPQAALNPMNTFPALVEIEAAYPNGL